MANFTTGQKFKNKLTGSNYEIYDVVGKAKNVPTETQILFLKLTSKTGFFQNADQFITITEREILNYFEPVLSK